VARQHVRERRYSEIRIINDEVNAILSLYNFLGGTAAS